jgi:hypothetical protein
MQDKNGKAITEGMYLKITGCKVKGDNGIYIVEKQYNENSYCLHKVKQSGEQSTTKYNIYFLDTKHDHDKEVTIIQKEDLKQAAKEVKNFINGVTSGEVIHSFVRSEQQEATEGKYIKFIKSVLLVGHINSFSGTYAIKSINKDNSVSLHLCGKRGEEISFNVNNSYGYRPIMITFKADVMKRLFAENYIEVLERISTTKGEARAEKQAADHSATKTEIKDFCYECACYGASCAGCSEPWTGCVYFRKIGEPEKQKIITEPEATKTAEEPATAKQQEPEAMPIQEPEQQQEEITIQGKKQETETEPEQQTETRNPVYYPINEEAAKYAQSMWSFSDYITGNETAVYRREVDKAYLLAAQVAEKRPEKAADAYSLAAKFSRKYADWKNTGFQIELMCPSVMISGASNFPIRKKEKQNKRRDKHMEEYNYIMGIQTRIENMLNPCGEVIKSNDENAIEQLQNKIDGLKTELEQYKAMNAYYRKHSTMQGFHGLTEEQATKMDQTINSAYSWDKCPAPSYELTSIRNKIKAAEGRITEIQRLKQTAEQRNEQPKPAYNSSVCEVKENADNMRIQLFFNGKPSEGIRDILKSHGFRWAPSEGAWQRQLTDNARYSTKQALKQIEEMEGKTA